MTYTEVQLFDDEGAKKVVKERTTPDQFTTVRERRPGWVLLAQRSGLRGYHRVRAVGQFASVVTACDLVGRVVPETQTQITECIACGESES